MSARKAAPKRVASTEDDEVQFIRSSKRHAATLRNNLNTKVFPSTPVLLASEKDSSATIQSLQAAQGKGCRPSQRQGVQGVEGQGEEPRGSRGVGGHRERLSKGPAEEKGGGAERSEGCRKTFHAEKVMAVSGAKVVARWELMREWLSGQTDSWDPVNTIEQYKVPGGEEVKKAPEPDADDPPTE
ncbi:hypothetical protein DY000_02040761 [Brassica cretica]|uniref:Chromo domain-containing protein n=1 Tax=Brassica cretica TaxID=69181 RepID=A0ABQ7BAA0_BRACR|nr:hypothetical protein DY000_02040761 [Brassica cretica]